MANNTYYCTRRTTQGQWILFRCVVASGAQPASFGAHSSTVVKQGAESRRRDASPSSLRWSSAWATAAKRALSLLPSFRLKSSLRRSETLAPFSASTHLASESAPSCSSHTVGGSAVSKQSTAALIRTVRLPCLRTSATSTFSTTSSQEHRQNKGSTPTSSTNPPTGALRNVG